MNSTTQLIRNSEDNYKLSVYAGDSYLLKITITDKDGTVLDLTGKTVTISVRKYIDSTADLISDTATNLVQSGTYKGMAIYQFTPTQTLTTLGRGSFKLEIKYTHSATEIKRIQGVIVIE